MATLEEIYQQVTGDDEQKAAFADAAQTEETLAKFLASLGCDATPEEVAAFLQAQAAPEGELSDDELDDVAGGCGQGDKVKRSFFGNDCTPDMIRR